MHIIILPILTRLTVMLEKSINKKNSGLKCMLRGKYFSFVKSFFDNKIILDFWKIFLKSSLKFLEKICKKKCLGLLETIHERNYFWKCWKIFMEDNTSKVFGSTFYERRWFRFLYLRNKKKCNQ